MRDRSSVLVRGLRILRSYIATHPLPFTIAVTGAAVYAAATIGTTVVLGRITDHVLRPAFEHGELALAGQKIRRALRLIL